MVSCEITITCFFFFSRNAKTTFLPFCLSPNPFRIRPSGGTQEPVILPATIPPKVLWYFERLVNYLNSKHHPNFFKLEKHDQAKYKNPLNNLNKGQDPEQDLVQVQYQDQDDDYDRDQNQIKDVIMDQVKDQDLYNDQKVMSYLHTMVVKMAKEHFGGQEATNESTEEEHRAYEGPTIDQEIKFKRSDLDEKVFMTRSGKRALVQPVPIRLTNWINPIYCNKRREEAKENRGLEDEEKLNMTREGKWPKGRCSIVRMDQTLCMRCVWDKMKKGTDEYKYFMVISDAEKRDKQFMIRMG